MKRFLTVAMAAAAVSVTMTAQTTVQGIPWNGPARSSALSAPANEARTIDPSQVSFWTGTGSNTSYLVIQWGSDRETCSHVFGYRYDGEKSGWDMISAVVAAHPQLYMLTHVTSMGNTVAGLGLDVDGNGKQLLRLKAGDPVLPDKETSYVETHVYDYDSWTAVDQTDLWNSGWNANGYWTYYVKDTIADDFEYSQKGASNRVISDGSVDGWIFRQTRGEDTPEWKPLSYDTAPWTAAVTVDGISYRPVNTMGVGSEAYVAVAPAESGVYSGRISIPASVEISGKTHTVSSIASSAFAGSAITSFTTTSSIGLGYEAFKGCASLTSVSFPDDWDGPWTGDGAFEDCSSLSSVPFGVGQTIPARYAAGSALTEFTVPESVKAIGSRALATSSLAFIKACPRKPAECAADAFLSPSGVKLLVPYGCTGLYAAAEVWKGFTDVEEYASLGARYQIGDIWYEVVSVEPNEVHVAYPGPTTPDKYTATLANAYNDVADKIFINGGSNGREWQLRLPTTVDIEGEGTFAVTGIGRMAFVNAKCPTVKNFTIKDAEGRFNESIRYIGESAFRGANPSGINLPPMVETVGEYAFADMWDLISLDSENRDCPLITEIPAYMCYGDRKLRWCSPLYLGKVTKVGENAFNMCPADFQVEKELSWLEEAGDNAFSLGYTSSTSFRYAVPLTDKLRRIGRGAFANCQISIDGGSTFTMHKDGVYGNGPLQGSTGIEKIVVEDGIKEIPAEMFTNMQTVTSVELPSSLETIGESAFSTDRGLTEISLPVGLKTIANNAFKMTSLVSVDLPASVEVCEGLWGISTLKEVNIPENSNLRSATFAQTGISTVFIPDGVETMPSFSNCNSFTGYTGARNVRSLPANVFSGTNIEEALIPPTTITIGDYAWSNCPNLKEIVIPEGVTQIGGRVAFSSKAIERVVLPSSIEKLNGTFRTFDGVPATADLWICVDDYAAPGLVAASNVAPSNATSWAAAKHFAHYYVLSGTKAASDVWAGTYLTTTEVPLSVGFPEEHAVASEWDEGLDLSDVMIEVVPSVSLAAEDLAEEDIPTAFMDANMKLMLTDNRGKALFAGEYRPEGTEAAWTPFEVEVVAPSAEARTMPEWKYVMKADGLTPGMPYEYTLSRLDGQTLIPENAVRYFTAASGTSVGVDELETSYGEGAVRVYDAAGTLLPGLRKGINIVVGQDGKARKVFVRE